MSSGKPRRLSVVVVPEWYPSAASPTAGSFIRDQVRAVEPHHDLTVVVDAPGAVKRIREFSADSEAEVVRLERRRSAGPADQLLRAAAFRRFLNSMPRHPDVVHAHVYASGFASVIATFGTGIPLVLSEHNSDFIEGLVRGRSSVPAHAALRGADLVCPVSRVLMQSMKAFEAKATYRVVPNVVDTSPFKLGRKRELTGGRPPRLLSVGIMGRQKGLACLIDAAASVMRSGQELHLELVGDGPLRSDLEAKARKLLPAGSYTFTGELARQEVAERMAQADLYVMPSIVETFGVALVEALAAGLPVVATAVGVAPEIVGPADGVVVAAGDPVALADGIGAALSGLDRFNPAPTGDRLSREFSAETVGDTWDAIYRELAGRSG